VTCGTCEKDNTITVKQLTLFGDEVHTCAYCGGAMEGNFVKCFTLLKVEKALENQLSLDV
jgi:hypothetical protein